MGGQAVSTSPAAGRDRPSALEPSALAVPPAAATRTEAPSGSQARLFLGLLGAALRGRLTPRERGRRLRLFFEARGGLWVKLSQLLALRRDVFD
ncbi:MAG TPA: hypothetical protein VFK70_11505, partial [Vicinamibacteria bacterium]|nr:hypothetical protein [Vicinamibacteria bacterium]